MRSKAGRRGDRDGVYRAAGSTRRSEPAERRAARDLGSPGQPRPVARGVRARPSPRKSDHRRDDSATAVTSEHFVVRRGLLRAIVGTYARRPASDLKLSRGPYGKPSFDVSVGGDDLSLSVSHSDDLVLYASRVGERSASTLSSFGRYQDGDEIVARFFTVSERATYRSLAECERARAFLRWWTCKEAYLKATGAGLGGGLDDRRRPNGRRTCQAPSDRRRPGRGESLVAARARSCRRLRGRYRLRRGEASRLGAGTWRMLGTGSGSPRRTAPDACAASRGRRSLASERRRSCATVRSARSANALTSCSPGSAAS